MFVTFNGQSNAKVSVRCKLKSLTFPVPIIVIILNVYLMKCYLINVG